MRAAFIRSWGRPLEVVEVGSFEEPLLGPDGVLVEVAAASVNPVDWKIIAGGLRRAYPHHLPLIPGWDVSGTVAAVGPAVTSVAVGDRVAAYARKDHVQLGTFAQRVALPERCVARVPQGVDLGTAAALPLAGLTAEQVLDAVSVEFGDTVLVHAAAGGVGTFVVQLALLRGARVIGTASPVNHELLHARGVEPVDYHRDVGEQVRSAAPDGVDVVIDLVGGAALATAPQVLVAGGRVASITDARAVAGLSTSGGYRGRYVFVRPDAHMLERLLGLVEDDDLVVDIAGEYPLDEAAQALEANRSGHTRGKISVRIGAY